MARITTLRQSETLYREILRRDPLNTFIQGELAFNYNFLGDAYLAAGDRRRAVQSHQEGLHLLEPLLPSGNGTFIVGAVLLCRKLGEAFAANGDPHAALAFARRALAVASSKGEARPAGLERYLTPRGYAAYGTVLAAIARSTKGTPANRAEARLWLKKAIDRWKELESHPTFSAVQRREMRAAQSVYEALP